MYIYMYVFISILTSTKIVYHSIWGILCVAMQDTPHLYVIK